MINQLILMPQEAAKISSFTPIQLFKLIRYIYRTCLVSKHLVGDTEEYLKNLGLIKLFDSSPLYLTATHIILAAQRFLHWKKSYDDFAANIKQLVVYSDRFSVLSKGEMILEKVWRSVKPFFTLFKFGGLLAFHTFRLYDVFDFSKDEIGAEISFNLNSLKNDWESLQAWLNDFGQGNILKPFINEVANRLFSLKPFDEPDALKLKPTVEKLDAPWKQLTQSARIEALSTRIPCKVKI